MDDAGWSEGLRAKDVPVPCSSCHSRLGISVDGDHELERLCGDVRYAAAGSNAQIDRVRSWKKTKIAILVAGTLEEGGTALFY